MARRAMSAAAAASPALAGGVSFISRMNGFAERNTLPTAMVMAGTKGAAADAMSQLVLQQEDAYDPARTLAFGIWSGGYCGGILYVLYNRVFPFLWPLKCMNGLPHKSRFYNVLAMVAFDNFVSSPFFFIPSYYVVRESLRSVDTGAWRDGPVPVIERALSTYTKEFLETCGLTWTFWIPLHFLTFGGLVPQHLRVHFTAVCSFGTLMAHSSLQGYLEKRRQ